MLAHKSISGSAATASSFYRRNATCKAPRKRSFLMRIQIRAPRSVQAVVGGDGSDGKGPRNPVICCWDNGDSSEGRGAGRFQATQGLLACCIAAGIAAVSWPHPATAAIVDDAKGNNSVFAASFQGQQGASHDVFLTEEEKELLDPKQYRVREWVYVH